MTLHSASRKTLRRTTIIGTWIVRTTYKAGKTTLIAREMIEYKLALLGMCKTRWTQLRQTKLSSGYMLFCSVHEEDNAPHTQGVADMLAKEAHVALISKETIKSMIIKTKASHTQT